MGVFDLCHFDLLKRGCANSGGFGARSCSDVRNEPQHLSSPTKYNSSKIRQIGFGVPANRVKNRSKIQEVVYF